MRETPAWIIGVLAVCCLAAAGCGRKSRERAAEELIEKAIEKDTGKNVKVDIREDRMAIQAEDGEFSVTSGKSAKLPKGFPADVHIYKGATVAMAMSSADGFQVSLQTSDKPDKVAEVYKARMTADGWAQEMAMDTGGQILLTYNKENRSAGVMIGSDDDRTQITLTVARASK
ncbi:MAG: hypothetical protein JXR37_32835 [Kiritimatiellae bacterium]|nr:hypothetical protein [Kiritimatiellia bacterium]